ncbi:MAG: alpha/beta fold hydrolase [Lentilitoribacter sp.]
MKHILILLSTILALSTPSFGSEPYAAGMRAISIDDPNGQRNLEGFLWHPTEHGQPSELDFDSKVWVGTSVIKDAKLSDGHFPLVVLSHGMFGNAYNQAWLAAALAKKGYLVAAVNHPGTSTWLRDENQRRELWKRPQDISRVIDHLTTSDAYATHIDPSKIFMAGHSLGGFTAALLAGARYDAHKFEEVCAEVPDELVCKVLNGWKIAKTPEDRTQMEADLSDDRIKAFAIFDLGGTQSFSTQSLSQITRPMLVFGAPIMNSGLTLDIESRALVKALPKQNVEYIEHETMSHFDFFGLCKSGGYELLKNEEPGDEIICQAGGDERAKKHKLIIENVLKAFQ